MPNDLLVDHNSSRIYAIDNEGFIDTWSYGDDFNTFRHLATKSNSKLKTLHLMHFFWIVIV